MIFSTQSLHFLKYSSRSCRSVYCNRM